MPPIVNNFRLSLLFVLAFLLLGVWAWFTDFVTIQGETTVYTADCANGEWKGDLCTGRLVPGERYRFRALTRRREVLFWKLGRDEPSGRFLQCQIESGRSWACAATPEAKRTITLSVVRGRATHDPSGATQPFHGVAKWRWLLLHWGVGMGQQADY
jgi:hypothetical protein